MHKDFKMKKETKRMLALGKFKDAQQKSDFKNMMIQAQCAEEKAKRDSQKSRPKNDE